MLCWSLSFYPQPIKNWHRRSTSGSTISFPTSNVLGFICYAVYTSTFYFSPVIRHQYAVRHPEAPEPTVRANDVAFAFHAVLLSVLTYSQFYPMIWGFKASAHQNVSAPVAGMVVGCVLCILGVFLLAWSKGGNDASDWAWIDGVRLPVVLFLILPLLQTATALLTVTAALLDLYHVICQVTCNGSQVLSPGVLELPAKVNGGMEHMADPS